MKPAVQYRITLATAALALLLAFLRPTLDSLILAALCLLLVWAVRRKYKGAQAEPDYPTERRWIIGSAAGIALFLASTFRQMLSDGIAPSAVVTAAVVSALALVVLVPCLTIAARMRDDARRVKRAAERFPYSNR